MPIVNVTDIALNEEVRELEYDYNNDPEVKKDLDQFNAECKIRRELVEAKKHNSITQTELK